MLRHQYSARMRRKAKLSAAQSGVLPANNSVKARCACPLRDGKSMAPILSQIIQNRRLDGLEVPGRLILTLPFSKFSDSPGVFPALTGSV